MESKFLKFHIFWKINTIYNFYLNLTLLTHLLEYRLFKELHVVFQQISFTTFRIKLDCSKKNLLQKEALVDLL